MGSAFGASVAPLPKDWNYANSIFFGNLLLGRVALRRDRNPAQVKISLLASARSPVSPNLNAFGPNMSLARDLLENGECEAVLEFFTLYRAFWKMGPAQLDEWTVTVKGGAIPEFGANLLY